MGKTREREEWEREQVRERERECERECGFGNDEGSLNALTVKIEKKHKPKAKI